MAESTPQPPPTEPIVDSVQSISSLPSGEHLETPAPSNTTSTPSPASASSPSAAASPKKLPTRSVLSALSPSQLDGFVSHLFRCLQTRAGADVVLLFLTYASRLSADVLESLSRSALRHSARRLVSLLFQLPPQTTVVLSKPPTPPKFAVVALDLAARLKALSGMLSEWRAMGRLFGLLGLYFAAKKLVAQAGTKKTPEEEKASSSTSSSGVSEARFDYLVECAQVASLIAFQAAENAAFLSSKKILPFAPQTQGRLISWSIKSWAAYVGMELGKLLIERQRKSDVGKRDVAWSTEWKKNFTNNLAWAPLTVHWSMKTGPLPDIAIPLCAMVPATSAMAGLWKSTA